MRNSISYSILALTVLAGPHANAQIAPDAGRVLREQATPPAPVPQSTDLKIQVDQTAESIAPGGAKTALNSVVFHGGSRVDNARLEALVAPAIGQEHDLAGLRQLAVRVTDFYRAQGYPFARAYIPAQQMAGGKLQIDIIEGRYGNISAVGDDTLTTRAQSFLAPLHSGDVIEAEPLERTALILGDQPGITVLPIIKPGTEVGTGDLEARVNRGRALEGKIAVDNHGNRYTGQHRAQAALNWNSPFMLGDQVSFSAMLTEENLWLGHVGYALPLGSSGLRGEVSYAHTSYELGKDFADLDATGTAKVTTVGLSYPIVRSRSHNLILSVQYQYKDLRDEYGSVDIHNDKSSMVLPIALQFDARDGFGGGGLTYGALTWTPGELSLDTWSLRDSDRRTARSQGSFYKFNLDIARLQNLDAGFALFGRLSAQWASKNLDSSESFSLGGINGVRAYPSGEGNSDKGWLAQTELRYNIGSFTPYLFSDFGKATYKESPWVDGDNHRSVSSFGAGVRFVQGQFGIDAAAAWAAHGGKPESDTREDIPRLWVKAEYRL